MVGTEDLLSINPRSMFLGQPQIFPSFIKKKPLKMIGHITTPSPLRNIKKGTHLIRQGFNKIDFLETKIIGYPRVKHDVCIDLLTKAGIGVATMTDWDYGMGYVGLESLAYSCLTMSKNSVHAKAIKSPIIDVRKPNDIINKAKYYHDNPSEYEHVRHQQYLWAEQNFSHRAISRRFRDIIQFIIDNNWKATATNKFRRLQ
jgi:hypothetical protein